MNIVSVAPRIVRIVFLVSASLLCAAAHTQEANLPGVFTNPNQSETPIKSAIEAGALQFGFLARPIARNRLKKINPNITRVAIDKSGDEFTITLGKSTPSAARPGGPAVKWTKDDETYDVSLAWQGSTLVQTFVAPDGTRVNRYRLAQDGQSLEVQISFSSRMLKAPISYTLTFARSAP